MLIYWPTICNAGTALKQYGVESIVFAGIRPLQRSGGGGERSTTVIGRSSKWATYRFL